MNLKDKFVQLGGICPAVGECFAPLSEEEISTLEQRLGSTLPESYREFVSQFGRSAFHEYVDFTPLQPFHDSPAVKGHLGIFFGGESLTHRSYSINWNNAAYSGRLPSELLPIGGDGGGDLICLSIQGESRGKVYYWDHTNEPLDEDQYREDYGVPRPSEAKWQNVTLIANTFDDFINRLEVSSE